MVKFKKEGEGSVSYAEIARGAYEGGRTRLATMVCPSLPIDGARGPESSRPPW